MKRSMDAEKTQRSFFAALGQKMKQLFTNEDSDETKAQKYREAQRQEVIKANERAFSYQPLIILMITDSMAIIMNSYFNDSMPLGIQAFTCVKVIRLLQASTALVDEVKATD
jgi:hypothetical protein